MTSKNSFLAHLSKSSEIVSTWPAWKQHALTPPISSGNKAKSEIQSLKNKSPQEGKKR